MRNAERIFGMATKRTSVTLFIALCSISMVARSQVESDRPTLEAVRLTDRVTIDGLLNEDVWERTGFLNFKQREPNQGDAPTEQTEAWIAYDDEALYVAARMYDSRPDSIMRILSRRDVMHKADWFGVFIDPYYDRRSGYYFALSASGTLADGVLYNDDWDDNSWDGVWEGKARVDERGWTLEMRIPFSQLRFHQRESYVWGINLRRDIGRKNEIDYVVYTPRKESGFVSRFADLVGIREVNPPNQIEILPYVNTRAEYTKHQPGDPFNNGSRYLHGIGTDVKIGLGSNLTMNATVNPDFGQVEVDPAVVNLSDVETFYQEKRPFFIEGNNIFRFGKGGATSSWGFNWSDPNLFYSRRIGRTPQGSIPTADFFDRPVGTRILGAGKVTGRLEGGWNVGTIHALTNREHADIQSGDIRSSVEIEPLTYYGVARVQREFNGGRQALGALSTLASRSFSDTRLRDEMNNDALFVGLDGFTFLDSEKEWVITGWIGASHVTGISTRMIRLQRNSQHYFQRPDASHVRVDSGATSLSGYAGRVLLNKQKGNVFANAAFGVVHPGFEINDLGFLSRTDLINMHVGAGYQWTEPTSVYRRIELGGALFQNLDFGNNLIWRGAFHFGFIRFVNYWSINWNFAYNPHTYDIRRTRGGPMMKALPGRQFNLGINSDDRNQFVFNVFVGTYRRTDEPSFYSEMGLDWKPAPNLTLRIGPSFSKDRSRAQWVTSVADPLANETFGRRYIFATLDQTTVGASVRLNWTFTPELSLQLYMQPLISAGSYTQFKELARPGTYDFNVFGSAGTITRRVTSSGGGYYDVDPDGSGPAQMVTFADPDFNLRSLRGNAVLRWEYRPGSVLYFVWTQSRFDAEPSGDFNFGRSMDRLVDAKPDNIFMIKFTYWWSL